MKVLKGILYLTPLIVIMICQIKAIFILTKDDKTKETNNGNKY